MNGPLAARILAFAAITACSIDAVAQAPSPLLRRWGIGLEVQPISLPGGHLGIPIGRDQSAFHLAFAIVVRYQIDLASAFEGGIGLPDAGLGFGGWLAYERFVRVAADRRGNVALEFYTAPGLQLSFAGPDYYAREFNVFVGHEYAAAGPLAFALRLPTGLRVSFAQSRFDVYAAVVPQFVLSPAVEVLLAVTTGIRVRF